jgi:hypothetical protein
VSVARAEHHLPISFHTPRVGEPYFSAECFCGWFGIAHSHERDARGEWEPHSGDLAPEPRSMRGTLLAWRVRRSRGRTR